LTQDSKIEVIVTGGTIDSKAYPDPENPPQYSTPAAGNPVQTALDTLKEAGAIEGDYNVTQWHKRADSQRFNMADLYQLAMQIKNEYLDGKRHFVITHGTSKMCENATQLKKFLTKSGEGGVFADLRLVFTGAMTPLANIGYEKEDATDNLTQAMQHVQTMEPGVCICMGDEVIDPATHYKDEANLCFVPNEPSIAL